MAFTTQPAAATRRSTARRFRWVLAGTVFVAALAVLAQLLWFSWWWGEEEPEPVAIRPPTGHFGDYDLPEPPPPEIIEVQVPVAQQASVVPKPEKKEAPRVQGRVQQPRRNNAKLPRLADVRWSIQEQEIPNVGYQDGRREMLAQGCALRPGANFIPAVLVTAVNSEIPGQVVAEVMSDVKSPDAGYENKTLVPQGTRVVGMLDKGERGLSLDRRRVDVAWTDMTLPGGRQIFLGRAFQAAADGSAGLGGRVEHRWGQLFVYAVLSTVFNVAQRGAISNENTILDSAQRETGRTLGDIGDTVLERSLEWEPTIVIDAGTQIRVLVNETLQVC